MNKKISRIEGKNINFRIIEICDAEFAISLRTDKQKNKYISKVDSNIETQREWIRSYKEREKNGSEYYFVIELKNGENVGLIRAYDFRNDSFCYGSWVIKNGAPYYVAIESQLMMYDFGFNYLGFKKSHFDVRKENIKVVRFHQFMGAKIVGESELDYYFNITKKIFDATKLKFSQYIYIYIYI